MIETSFIEPVQIYLPQVEQIMRSQSEGHHPAVGAALNHLLSSGGKRIRVLLTLLFGKMLGADPDRLIILAAAIESLHTATLVHDDLIDGALVRRGIPTLNAQWSPAATVLTGDFVFAQAAKLAAQTNSVQVMRLFSETLAIIVNGEITQLFQSRGVAKRDNYYQRIYAKTASLFEAASGSSALLSPVEEGVVQRAKRFGYEIGMAFQMVDDILDFTGEQAIMGKPVASDLRQSLITLPSLYYLENHPEDQDMKSVINSDFCDEECISRLLVSIRESGAIHRALGEARDSVHRGIALLREFPVSVERNALEALAQYIVERDI